MTKCQSTAIDNEQGTLIPKHAMPKQEARIEGTIVAIKTYCSQLEFVILPERGYP